MMFGYPGAGKTTTAKILSELTGAVHLSSDQLRLELFPNPSFSAEEHAELYRELDSRTEQLLSEGRDVIYDANLNRRQHRDEKYEICRRTGAIPKLIWVQTEKEIAKRRALHDSRSPLWPRYEHPSQLFDRVASIIEPPAENEAYVTLDGQSITAEQISAILD